MENSGSSKSLYVKEVRPNLNDKMLEAFRLGLDLKSARPGLGLTVWDKMNHSVKVRGTSFLGGYNNDGYAWRNKCKVTVLNGKWTVVPCVKRWGLKSWLCCSPDFLLCT